MQAKIPQNSTGKRFEERSGGEYHRQSYQHLSCRELRDYREEWGYGRDSSQLAEYHQIEITERY